jgi:hypothetical protein
MRDWHNNQRSLRHPRAVAAVAESLGQELHHLQSVIRRLPAQYCACCQSAVYCSRTCQRIDWKQRLGNRLLNVEHGTRCGIMPPGPNRILRKCSNRRRLAGDDGLQTLSRNHKKTKRSRTDEVCRRQPRSTEISVVSQLCL